MPQSTWPLKSKCQIYEGTTTEKLIQSVENIGYGAILYDEAHKQKIAEEKQAYLKKCYSILY